MMGEKKVKSDGRDFNVKKKLTNKKNKQNFKSTWGAEKFLFDATY